MSVPSFGAVSIGCQLLSMSPFLRSQNQRMKRTAEPPLILCVLKNDPGGFGVPDYRAGACPPGSLFNCVFTAPFR
jgi:hypothetical protein